MVSNASIYEDSSTHCMISITYGQSHASFLGSRETSLDATIRIADETAKDAVTSAMEPPRIGNSPDSLRTTVSDSDSALPALCSRSATFKCSRDAMP